MRRPTKGCHGSRPRSAGGISDFRLRFFIENIRYNKVSIMRLSPLRHPVSRLKASIDRAFVCCQHSCGSDSVARTSPCIVSLLAFQIDAVTALKVEPCCCLDKEANAFFIPDATSKHQELQICKCMPANIETLPGEMRRFRRLLSSRSLRQRHLTCNGKHHAPRSISHRKASIL